MAAPLPPLTGQMTPMMPRSPWYFRMISLVPSVEPSETAMTCGLSGSASTRSSTWARVFSSLKAGMITESIVITYDTLGSLRTGPNRSRQLRDKLPSGDLRVVLGLQIEPKFGGRSKVDRESRGGVRSNATTAAHDVVDPSRRHVDRPRQPVLTHVQRLEELLQQDFTRGDWRQLSGHLTF